MSLQSYSYLPSISCCLRGGQAPMTQLKRLLFSDASVLRGSGSMSSSNFICATMPCQAANFKFQSSKACETLHEDLSLSILQNHCLGSGGRCGCCCKSPATPSSNALRGWMTPPGGATGCGIADSVAGKGSAGAGGVGGGAAAAKFFFFSSEPSPPLPPLLLLP